MIPERESNFSETPEASEAREQGEKIVSLLLSPEIQTRITEANITAAEQDTIQEVDTADQFVAMSQDKKTEILEIYNKLANAA